MDVKNIKWILVVLVFFGCAGNDLVEKNPFLDGVELEGFGLEKPLTVYNKSNIFDYIDGEAEAYLPLGFRLLYSQTFRSMENDVLMMVDIYDMDTPEGARRIFDLYTQQKGSEVQMLGEKAWTDNYIVLFQRGKYFFRVWPDPYQDSDVKPRLKDMLGLSREIDLSF